MLWQPSRKIIKTRSFESLVVHYDAARRFDRLAQRFQKWDPRIRSALRQKIVPHHRRASSLLPVDRPLKGDMIVRPHPCKSRESRKYRFEVHEANWEPQSGELAREFRADPHFSTLHRINGSSLCRSQKEIIGNLMHGHDARSK